MSGRNRNGKVSVIAYLTLIGIVITAGFSLFNYTDNHTEEPKPIKSMYNPDYLSFGSVDTSLFTTSFLNDGDGGDIYVKITSDDVLISKEVPTIDFNSSANYGLYVRSGQNQNYSFILKLKEKETKNIKLNIQCSYTKTVLGHKSTKICYSETINYTLGNMGYYHLNK